MKKRVIILLTIVLLTISLISTVNAIDKSGAVTGTGVVGGAVDLTKLTESSAGSDTFAQGGNISFLNLSANITTIKWHGYLGNVTANLSLGSGTNILYSFGLAAKSQIKTIFASQSSTADFSTLAAINASAADLALGWAATDSDSFNSAFTSSTTMAQVAGVNKTGLNVISLMSDGMCNSTTIGGVTNGRFTWPTGVFNTSAASAVSNTTLVFGAPINATGMCDFKNSTVVNYELMVPVNNSGVLRLSTYFFFLDVE